jgi:hypothetical protein
LNSAASHDFGFEWLNSKIAYWTQATAGMATRGQTGQLNWNLVGIIGGLAVVLAILLGGM